LAIASVSLNGVVDNSHGVLFGRDFLNGVSQGGLEGTQGDAGGLDFTFKSETGGNAPYTVTVQYTNIAVLIGSTHTACSNGWSANFRDTGCQDEFGTVNFSFANNFVATSTLTPTNFLFFQDTDEATAPEPMTLGLTAVSLAALVIVYRRRHAVRS